MADLYPAAVWVLVGVDEDMKDTGDHVKESSLHLKCQETSQKDFKQA